MKWGDSANVRPKSQRFWSMSENPISVLIIFFGESFKSSAILIRRQQATHMMKCQSRSSFSLFSLSLQKTEQWALILLSVFWIWSKWLSPVENAVSIWIFKWSIHSWNSAPHIVILSAKYVAPDSTSAMVGKRKSKSIWQHWNIFELHRLKRRPVPDKSNYLRRGMMPIRHVKVCRQLRIHFFQYRNLIMTILNLMMQYLIPSSLLFSHFSLRIGNASSNPNESAPKFCEKGTTCCFQIGLVWRRSRRRLLWRQCRSLIILHPSISEWHRSADSESIEKTKNKRQHCDPKLCRDFKRRLRRLLKWIHKWSERTYQFRQKKKSEETGWCRRKMVDRTIRSLHETEQGAEIRNEENDIRIATEIRISEFTKWRNGNWAESRSTFGRWFAQRWWSIASKFILVNCGKADEF